LKGIKISLKFSLTHLLFVDDILIFCEGNISYISSLKEIVQTFCLTTHMQTNMDKSSLYTWGMTENENQHISRVLESPAKGNLEGMKYLGFSLKESNYRNKYWQWLCAKVKKQLLSWHNIWLSHAGRFILVKSILKAILVF